MHGNNTFIKRHIKRLHFKGVRYDRRWGVPTVFSEKESIDALWYSKMQSVPMQGACYNNNGVADSEDDDSYMAYVGDGALRSSLSMAIETR